jgi:DNA-binding response OmpR family regulator
MNLSVTCGVPIVFITASKDPVLLTRAREITGIPALEKPFDAKELVAVLEAHNGQLQPT